MRDSGISQGYRKTALFRVDQIGCGVADEFIGDQPVPCRLDYKNGFVAGGDTHKPLQFSEAAGRQHRAGDRGRAYVHNPKIEEGAVGIVSCFRIIVGPDRPCKFSVYLRIRHAVTGDQSLSDQILPVQWLIIGKVRIGGRTCRDAAHLFACDLQRRGQHAFMGEITYGNAGAVIFGRDPLPGYI